MTDTLATVEDGSRVTTAARVRPAVRRLFDVEVRLLARDPFATT